MNPNRLSQLRQLLADDPDDPFNQYALALELRAHNPQESLWLFDQLLTHHPGYLATYYPAAALFADLGQTDAAFTVYDAGIALAIHQKNDRTRLELARARQALEDDLIE